MMYDDDTLSYEEFERECYERGKGPQVEKVDYATGEVKFKGCKTWFGINEVFDF